MAGPIRLTPLPAKPFPRWSPTTWRGDSAALPASAGTGHTVVVDLAS